MAFKKIQHTNTCPETPEALYRDFKNRKIKGLLSQQADILRAYYSEGVDKTDLAFQLPTGSGKTLVGLLIAEWRRRKNGEKVVYICPTKQLANQVVEQSIEKYGIKCNAFVGQQTNYSPNIKSEYRNAETLNDLSPNADDKERNKLATAFEQAHVKLGTLLGYQSDNSNGNSDPDPWWIISDYLCFVFEDHSSANQESSIGSNKVRQAASHPNWIKEKNLVATSADVIPVIITPCKKINNDAIPHTQNVCYWNLQNFREWALKGITVIRELRSSFSGEADIEWRKRAIQLYKDNKIDPDSLAEYLKSKPLKNLSQE